LNFFIVSGLSGSGKTIALQALEDLGYYCIDNLPAVLLPQFAGEFKEQSGDGLENCAVGIDSRNRGFLASLPEKLAELDRYGLEYKIIFLQADERILLKRFSETRRKHPLTDHETALLEGIRRERELLLPLSSAAARRINTSQTTAQELRGLIRDFAGGELSSSLTLLFESFGYKFGPPLDADFVFDVRCLPNPYWQESLRQLSGLDAPVVEYLGGHDEVGRMVDQVTEFIDTWLPHFKKESRSYITVAIGCTGGQHRSVYVAQQLAVRFSDHNLNVQIRHRELA
jgi:UPF0042 nucleotide-binding protein